MRTATPRQTPPLTLQMEWRDRIFKLLDAWGAQVRGHMPEGTLVLQRQLSDFDVKLNCKITEANNVFKNWVWGNKRGCTWERVVLLAQQQEAGETPFAPTISSVLLILSGHCPMPRGGTVLVKCYALSTPISVLIWVSVCTEQKPELAVVRSLFCPSLMDVEPCSPY